MGILTKQGCESIFNDKVLGQHIQEARKRCNINQADLAEAFDVSVGFVGRIERGEQRINLERLAQISRILKVPAEKLITGCVAADFDSSSLTSLTAEEGEQLISGMLAGQSQKVVATAVSLVDSLIKNLH